MPTRIYLAMLSDYEMLQWRMFISFQAWRRWDIILGDQICYRPLELQTLQKIRRHSNAIRFAITLSIDSAICIAGSSSFAGWVHYQRLRDDEHPCTLSEVCKAIRILLADTCHAYTNLPSRMKDYGWDTVPSSNLATY